MVVILARRSKIFAAAATAVLAAAVFLMLLKPWQPRVDASSIARVLVFPPGGGWCLEILPDGSATLKYGANDSGRIGPGICDFKRVVAEAARQRTGSSKRGATQVALCRHGEDSTSAFCIAEDRIFRDLVRDLDGKWPRDSGRFDELRRSHPVYAAKDR